MDRKKQQDKVRLNSATSRKKSIKSQPPTSATLRSGRDDKGEGGDVYEEPLDRMDRKTQQIPRLRSG